MDDETYKFMLAPILANLLTQIVVANDKLPLQKLGRLFHSGNNSPPDITVQNYVDRIIKYCPCSSEAFICAFIFIDRLLHSKALRITSLNVHRILLTSIMISAKILDDCRWNNKYYSHVAGVTAKELLSLECRFLSMIDYSLHISQQLFESYRYEIELQYVRLSLAQKEGVVLNNNRPSLVQDPRRQESEDKNKYTAEAREKARMFSKTLRRSTSFNNSTSKKEIFNWRKRRSSSFSFLVEGTVSSFSLPKTASIR
jgi:hypothetical protein